MRTKLAYLTFAVALTALAFAGPLAPNAQAAKGCTSTCFQQPGCSPCCTICCPDSGCHHTGCIC